jgi:hypothetical protein
LHDHVPLAQVHETQVSCATVGQYQQTDPAGCVHAPEGTVGSGQKGPASTGPPMPSAHTSPVDAVSTADSGEASNEASVAVSMLASIVASIVASTVASVEDVSLSLLPQPSETITITATSARMKEHGSSRGCRHRAARDQGS